MEFIAEARGVGDSYWRNLNDDAIANNKSCRPLLGLDVSLHQIPGVPLRSTSGSTPPPAPQAENVNIRFAQKMWVMISHAGLPLQRQTHGDER
jgi:hypothetical protein